MQNNTDENFNEDFERLMKQFLSEEYKDVKLDDMQTEDEEDPQKGHLKVTCKRKSTYRNSVSA